VRIRLYAAADGIVRACNRKGQDLPVPQPIRELGEALFARLGRFDFDGEAVGNNEYHVFDVLHEDPEAPAKERATFLLGIANFFPEGVYAVPTALSYEAKTALMERAIAEGWEGLMFKRQDASYRPGRSRNDFKYKLWNTATVLLTGINATGRL